ncbi:MAG: tetratricopeptide repeat protein [Alphaproteobacteria bacterium]|nr:tetratricopeptide repeat protein [Alphaproteobacteria bacterium]
MSPGTETAEAHFKAGRLMEAQAAFWALVQTNPRQPGVWTRLGEIALKLGHANQAFDFFGNAYDMTPNEAKVRLGLGQALRLMGRLEEAIPQLKKAALLDSELGVPHLELAQIMDMLGRLEEASDAWSNYLARHEHDAKAMMQSADVLMRLKRYDEADELLHMASLLESENPAPLVMQGTIRLWCNETDAAERLFHQALEVDPEFAPALFSLGNLAMSRDDFSKASDLFEKAHDAAPQDPRITNNLGVSLKEQGRLDEAETILRKAVETDPNFADAHWNLSTVLFLKGAWKEGFDEAEWRWEMTNFSTPKRDFNCAPWDGKPLPQGTLLVHAEQGLGDAFQFVRYLPMLAKRARHVVLEADPKQASLFTRSLPMIAVVERGNALPKADAHLALLSAPRFLEAPYGCEAYLSPDPERLAYWKNRLAANKQRPGPWVGLAWQGNPGYHADRRRSPGLAPLLDLLDLPAINLASLQTGIGREQLLRLSEGPLDLGNEEDPAIGSGFEGTAAIVSALDLVITSDSAIAHLAGALGKPLWILLPHIPDWRWQMEGETSPWYPGAKLFRQPTPGDWATPVNAVIERLRGLYV